MAGSGPAFAAMTAQVYEEVTRNTQRLPQLETLDIPVKLIWGEADLDLNIGVAPGPSGSYDGGISRRDAGRALASSRYA